jgi:cytidine deaminase
MNASHRQALIAAALAAREKAHAPYSKFLVGAAVLTESGAIYAGCNVENASYGLTICAERVAICSAVAAGDRALTAMVVATSGRGTPCGACRQFAAEFRPDLPILLVDADRPDSIVEKNLAELLPNQFRL